jgi:hypothetical protein
MPRPRRPQTLPLDILPPDLFRRHDLVHRLYLGPLRGLTPPHPWAPMTDAEWHLLRSPSPAPPPAGPAGPWPTPAPGSTRSSAPSP